MARLDATTTSVDEFVRTDFVKKMNLDLESFEAALAGTPRFLLLGSSVRDRGGVQLLVDDSTNANRRAMSILYQVAVDFAVEREAAVVGVNVPDEQILALRSTIGCVLIPIQTRFQFELWLGGMGSIESFLRSLDSKTRRTWKRDLSAEQTGFTPREEFLTEESIVEAAPLIASVRDANQSPSHPVLVEYELSTLVRQHGSHVLLFTCRRDKTDELIAASVAVHRQEKLEVLEVGMVDRFPERSLLYRTTVFLSPLAYALRNGLPRVGLGYGHELPKRSRGANAEPMHTVVLRSKRLI